MISKESQLLKVHKLLNEKTSTNFYGEILVKFECGRIVYARVAENIKPSSVIDVMSAIQQFFDKNEECANTVLMIKKINGKPHIGITTSGQFENLEFMSVDGE